MSDEYEKAMKALLARGEDEKVFKSLLELPGFELMERAYRIGRKEALIETIAEALAFGAEIPVWARYTVVEAFYFNKPKSWDDLFGTPFPKGAKVASLQKLNRISYKVFSRVKKLNAQGEPIGEELFERVGKEFAVSLQTVRAIYYDKSNQIADALVEWKAGLRDGADELTNKRNERRLQKLTQKFLRSSDDA
jgi:hypothetical protein